MKPSALTGYNTLVFITPWDRRSPILYADKLTPRKSNFHPETMTLATYLVLVLQSQSIWSGPQGTLRLPDPICHPTNPHHSLGCVPASSLATQGPKGPQMERGREGCQQEPRDMVGADFSGSPCLGKSFKLSSCHPQHFRDSYEAGNGEIKAAGWPQHDACHCHTPTAPRAPQSPAPGLGGCEEAEEASASR